VAYLSGRAGVSGTDAVRVAVHGRPVPEERGSYGPSAPFAVSASVMDGNCCSSASLEALFAVLHQGCWVLRGLLLWPV
jgi:hypothetical protein